MGAPVPKVEAADTMSAEAFLSSFETIAAKERRRHASVYNYWLSIRGDRPFPPIRDLDPLEIADAGPSSVLLEMIGGGDDAEVRHLGQAIKAGLDSGRISEAASPSLLSCIRAQLPIVAACRQPIAFEQEFAADDGKRRCWVSLLPFSGNGTLIDYVYGFVSLDGETAAEADEQTEEAEAIEQPAGIEGEPFKVPLRPLDEDQEPVEAAIEPDDAVPEAIEELAEPEAVAEEMVAPEPDMVPVDGTSEASDELPMVDVAEEPVELTAEAPEPGNELSAEPLDEWSEPAAEAVDEAELADDPVPTSRASKPGFSAKLLESLASIGGFYGQSVQVDPNDQLPDEPADPSGPPDMIDEPTPTPPIQSAEGNLQTKLNEVRAKAEEARQAQIRSQAALMEGLSAAYDFALDAESEPEEYLRLVESQGLKIQLRSPMKPVVKLGFDGMCDDQTIADLEAVLAWALKQDLPRGSLAERIEAAGGIGPILGGQASS